MALQTFVKVSSISSLSDARYCAGMGVDVLGFNIDPSSSDFVSETDFKEITDWVAGVEFAGEFHSGSLEDIKNAIRLYPVDFIEISEEALIEPVALLGKPVIFRILTETEQHVEGLDSTLSYLDELAKIVVVRCENPALFEKLDEKLSFYNGNPRLVKGYGIVAESGIGRFPGLEMEATREEKPGLKDYGEIMDVLEILDED